MHPAALDSGAFALVVDSVGELSAGVQGSNC